MQTNMTKKERLCRGLECDPEFQGMLEDLKRSLETQLTKEE